MTATIVTRRKSACFGAGGAFWLFTAYPENEAPAGACV